MTTIELAAAGDGEAVADIYRPAVTDSSISFEFSPPDGKEMSARIERTLTQTPWIVCRVEGRVLGYAYAGRHRDRDAYQWSTDISAYVHADARRIGLGRALYTSFATVGVYHNVGFKNGQWHDTIWLERAMAVHDAAPTPPEPPVPLPRLVGTPALEGAFALGLPLLRVV